MPIINSSSERVVVLVIVTVKVSIIVATAATTFGVAEIVTVAPEPITNSF